MDNTEPLPTAGTARRRLLAAGASGAAMSLLPFLAGRARAGTETTDPDQSSPAPSIVPPTDPEDTTAGTTGDTTGGSTGASTEETVGAATATTPPPTTSEAPKRPTEEDLDLLVFLQSAELAARDLYNDALGAGTFDAMTQEVIRSIAEAHEAYAQSISGLIGRSASNNASTELVDSLSDAFGGDAKAVFEAARQLENNLVATHTEAVGTLAGIDGSALIASVAIVEARHATVLAHLAGVNGLDDQIATEGEALAAPKG